MSAIPLSPTDDAPRTADLDIVIPVHNEEEQLAASITILRAYLDSSLPCSATVTIVDNASTDGTARIAAELAAGLPGVQAICLPEQGRGLALRTAWTRSTASVVAYMDVDLATGLEALLPLVAPLLSGHSDVAIGSRLATGAHVIRGTKREFISRAYNLLLRAALRSACTDAQCGFKAMRRDTAVELLPRIRDDQWFFDTELLVTAQRIGLRIHEVPVDWVDDTDSRVDLVRTVLDDLRGVVRMLGPSLRRRERHRPAGSVTRDPLAGPMAPPLAVPLAPGGAAAPAAPVFSDELLRFAGVGAVSTAVYAGLFAGLEPVLGSYLANTVAIGLCSLGNTTAHRGMAGAARHGLDRNHRLLTAGALLTVSLSVSTGALAAIRAVGLTSLAPELCAVTTANVGAAVIRFAILRSWVFRPAFGTHAAMEVPS